MVCAQGIMGGLRVTGEFTMSQEEHHSRALPWRSFTVSSDRSSLPVSAGWRSASTNSWRDARMVRKMLRKRPRQIAFSVQHFARGRPDQFNSFLAPCYRHLQVPATAEVPAHHPMWALVGHISFSVVVVLLLGLRRRAHAQVTRVHLLRRTLGQLIMVLVALQFLLGHCGASLAVILRPEVG